MEKKDKRILWLINHATLMEFEVPLLISFGYEVYLPKQVPKEILEWSGTIDYTYDQSLTIPQSDLDKLNQHNFYETEITPPIRAILNRYFGTAFCICIPKLFNQITQYYNGRILLRTFGLCKDSSYESVLTKNLGKEILKRLTLLGDRFWFAQAYEGINSVEHHLFKSKTITLPVGIPDQIFKFNDAWRGTTNKILFFCPRIMVSPTYYGKIYREFNKNFGNFPHVIAGYQALPVDDPSVLGYQPQSVINDLFSTCAVMFYHSQEPRHLHYHPLEAIVFGMPLIYMKGGILEQLGGKNQPGACATFKEARTKIKKILKNNQDFIAEVRNSQKIILENFKLKHVREEWQRNFVSKIMTTSPKIKPRIKTIGVFLLTPYRGGSLSGAKNIAKMLHLGSRSMKEPVNIVFSCIANSYNISEDFDDLLDLGIGVRETTWQPISKSEAEVLQSFIGTKKALQNDFYILPNDGINNFSDCEFWLLISDRIHAPIIPNKPYGIVVYDYIQRYVPSIFPEHFSDINFITAARKAQFVLTTTPQTRSDAIQYAGVSPERVHIAPMEFNPFSCETIAMQENLDYFIWPTNSTQHKNYLSAIDALSIYYSEFKGKLKVIMTGTLVDFFIESNAKTHPIPYFQEVADKIIKNKACKENLRIMGALPSEEYISTLASAKFLWHPTVVDNGTYAVVEAAYYGVPSLSNDYPQMRYMNERFNLNLTFCDATHPRTMAMKLKEMEENHLLRSQNLPSKKFLEQFTYHKLAPEFWNLIRNLL